MSCKPHAAHWHSSEITIRWSHWQREANSGDPCWMTVQTFMPLMTETMRGTMNKRCTRCVCIRHNIVFFVSIFSPYLAISWCWIGFVVVFFLLIPLGDRGLTRHPALLLSIILPGSSASIATELHYCHQHVWRISPAAEPDHVIEVDRYGRTDLAVLRSSQWRTSSSTWNGSPLFLPLVTVEVLLLYSSTVQL